MQATSEAQQPARDPSLRIAILGASGYGGGELLRYLTQHPSVPANRIQAISNHAAGQLIGSVHPHLALSYPQHFLAELDLAALSQSENSVLFAALAHGEFAKLWPELKPKLPSHCRVIDLSADFRLDTAEQVRAAYRLEHPCPELLADFLYALPEANQHRYANSTRHLANPGCFATAISLSLLPLSIDARFGQCDFAVSAITGSSGSGAQAQAGTHHPARAQDFRAYKVLEHQHQAEIQLLIEQVQAAHHATPQTATTRLPLAPVCFSLVAHSAPLIRGIHVTVQARLPAGVSAADLRERFAAYYRHSPLVQISDSPPRVACVAGSAFAQLQVSASGEHFAVLCAIDNLGKGMAAQAIQNMNILFGLEATSGLRAPAIYP